jgi:hypothetical protein
VCIFVCVRLCSRVYLCLCAFVFSCVSLSVSVCVFAPPQVRKEYPNIPFYILGISISGSLAIKLGLEWQAGEKFKLDRPVRDVSFREMCRWNLVNCLCMACGVILPRNGSWSWSWSCV